MIRRLDGQRPGFVLDTAHTTYAFSILPTGHAEHLYYGGRIPIRDAAALASLAEKHAFPAGNTVVCDPSHPEYALEELSLEVSARGRGDVRDPFVEIVHADGSRTSDFTFRSAEITNEKPPFRALPGSYDESGAVWHLCLTLEDKSRALALEVHYYVYPECDCICRSARLVNEGAEPVQLERLMSTQLDLPGSPWAVKCFHGAWISEMRHDSVVLPAGRLVFDSAAGSSSSRVNPLFLVHAPDANETSGEVYGFNLIYSGDHYASVEVGAFGKTRVVSGLQPAGFRFLLAPGESFEAPEAVMTWSGSGFAELSLRLHRFVREHIVRGAWKKKERPVLLNSWEACYFNISESRLLSLARAAKDVGVELFVMDDGWFGERSDDSHSLGDWTENRKKLPGGLAGLAKKVNDLGLRFGLWVEPEMVNVQSELYRAHPDWVMQIPGKPHAEGRNQRLLDLSNPAVQDHLIETMSRVFSSAAISYVKWDCNRIFSDAYSPCLPAERQGEVGYRYVCGLYRVMAALTERFPDILFEGCASGGNRFDLGILCYFPQIWASDNTDAVCRARIQEGYSFGYPPSVLGAHVSASPNHQTLRDTPLATRFHVASFALLGYECDLRDLSADEKREIREQIALYKKWREVLQFGDFYRGRSGNVHEWTCVSPDRRRAVGLLLRELAETDRPSERFRARGLDPDATYQFYNLMRRVDVRCFGSLINTLAPIHVRPDSVMHDAIARVVKMPGETENALLSGGALMDAGIPLHQAYCGTGFNEEVRVFPDFASRLYFMEAQASASAKKK